MSATPSSASDDLIETVPDVSKKQQQQQQNKLSNALQDCGEVTSGSSSPSLATAVLWSKCKAADRRSVSGGGGGSNGSNVLGGGPEVEGKIKSPRALSFEDRGSRDEITQEEEEEEDAQENTPIFR